MRYIVEKPPMEQVVVERNGDRLIEWQDHISPVDTMGKLIKAVRQTRNNLFHGGKTATGPVVRAERNEELITAATAVLRGMLNASPTVKDIFILQDDG